MSTDSTNVEVDVNINTDDLDAFSEDFFGKTRVEKPTEDVKPADDDASAPEAEELTDEVVEEVEAEADEATDETPVDEEAEEDDVDQILKPKPKKKPSVQERISELTRMRHEEARARQEAERARDEAVRALEASRVSPKIEPQAKLPAVAMEEGAPDPAAMYDDGSLVYTLGEFDPAFIRDLTIFTITQANAAANEKKAQEDAQRLQHEAEIALQTEWADKLTNVEKELPDLRATLATLDTELQNVEPALGQYLAQTIMGMTVGPQVLYYLANNVDEARKIIAAGPVGATLALGKLEDKIERSQSKKAKEEAPVVRASNAPKPPVATRGTATRAQVADDTDDLDAFEAKFFEKRRR